MLPDVMFYYAKVFPKLKYFLRKRELATIIKLKDIEIVKRGSHEQPLFIDELIKYVNKKFLSLRYPNVHLKDVEKSLIMFKERYGIILCLGN